MIESPEDIIKNIAHKNDLDHKQVAEIVYAPFKLAAETIKGGNTEKTIILPHFGKFKVKPARKRHVDKNTPYDYGTSKKR